MINLSEDLSIYVFNLEWIKMGFPATSMESLTLAGVTGKFFELTEKAIEIYNNLLEILEETACGKKDIGGESVP
jgi:hypothetical protein